MRAIPWPRPAVSRRLRQSLVSAGWLLAATWLLPRPAPARADDQMSDPDQLRQTLLVAYQEKQIALAQEQQALSDSGATPEQIQAWQLQNVQRIAAQQHLAQRISLLGAWDQSPPPGPATIPVGASPTLGAFLRDRTGLAHARAALHNQRVQALPADATAEEIVQGQQEETAQFAQQQAATLAAQVQRAQNLAQESARRVAAMPPALQIPAGATPQMAAYLVARDQIMRAQVQFRNQYAGADPAARQAALEQWQQQHAAASEQLHVLADALAQTH